MRLSKENDEAASKSFIMCILSWKSGKGIDKARRLG